MARHETDNAKTPPSALGEFLRAARERLAPEDFSLPMGTRRRAKGLRREEVASLCGISPTWYTWIEQGRTAAISVATLADLAAGLRLSAAERAYLFQLAGRADPAMPALRDDQAAPYAGLVEGIRSPAYMLDRYWNAIAWNPPAARLFLDWLGASHIRDGEPPPNLLRYVFLNPAASESPFFAIPEMSPPISGAKNWRLLCLRRPAPVLRPPRHQDSAALRLSPWLPH